MRTAENLRIHELIGLEVEVERSSCRKWIGIKGRVVDETKNLLVIEKKGKESRIPKISCSFLFILEDRNKVRLDGKDIAFRPEERTKKAL
ncbi:ribonuclease P protein component 1 [Candidatus Micrarchaeota archaeon]|nr:ribonuclease P protein component 1 [Candidatus Micrarchaeota archaeon]